MITDAILWPLVMLAEWLERTLPDGAPLGMPDTSSFWSAVAGLNSLVPVGEVLVVALSLFAALAVFLVIRLVLLVWNLVYP